MRVQSMMRWCSGTREFRACMSYSPNISPLLDNIDPIRECAPCFLESFSPNSSPNQIRCLPFPNLIRTSCNLPIPLLPSTGGSYSNQSSNLTLRLSTAKSSSTRFATDAQRNEARIFCAHSRLMKGVALYLDFMQRRLPHDNSSRDFSLSIMSM